jgi:hypothetical protein
MPQRFPVGETAPAPKRRRLRTAAIVAIVVVVVAGITVGVNVLLRGGNNNQHATAATVPVPIPAASGPVVSGKPGAPGIPGRPGAPGAPRSPGRPGVSGAADAPAGAGGVRVGTTTTRPTRAAAPPVKQQVETGPGPSPLGDPSTITGYGSNRCIDVTDGNYADSPRLQIWTCTAGDRNQQWTFYDDGTVRAFNRCMTAQNGSLTNGTWIVLQSCDGSTSQRFVLNSAHDLTRGDRCVDAMDEGTASGTKLQLWECGGTSNQKWH